MKLNPHPATQILLWVLFALLVQRLHFAWLLAWGGSMFVVALRLCADQLLSLLRRTRWILLSLLLIYAYTTAGTALWASLGSLSPTREGILDGLVQLGRLVSVLSSLAILLALLSQERLIGGLYTLLYPLHWLGMSRERIAVRLALTLAYAEPAMRDTASDWKSTISRTLQATTTGAAHIELRLQSFVVLDCVLLLSGLALLIGAWR